MCQNFIGFNCIDPFTQKYYIDKQKHQIYFKCVLLYEKEYTDIKEHK